MKKETKATGRGTGCIVGLDGWGYGQAVGLEWKAGCLLAHLIPSIPCPSSCITIHYDSGATPTYRHHCLRRGPPGPRSVTHSLPHSHAIIVVSLQRSRVASRSRSLALSVETPSSFSARVVQKYGRRLLLATGGVFVLYYPAFTRPRGCHRHVPTQEKDFF